MATPFSVPQLTFSKPPPANLSNSFYTKPAPLPLQQPSGTAIDIAHLRPTTKYDQVTKELQDEISAVDEFVLLQINLCHELSATLPAVIDAGTNLPNDVAYVSEKLEDLHTALENDAEEIVDLRDKVVKRDIAEGQLCWRNVDRLKMPSQYQTRNSRGPDAAGASGSVYGGSGLSGWWNNPQMIQKSARSNALGGSRSVHVADAEAEENGAPGTLVDLFSARADDMRETLQSNREVLGEIESFVRTVEEKIMAKEREINERYTYNGRDGALEKEDERANQLRTLKFVFGTVERGLYESADNVARARDLVKDMIMDGVGSLRRDRPRF